MRKKKPIRVKPKGERKPHRERVYSTNFMDNMLTEEFKCFVPLEDYALLKRKYRALFKRYKREIRRLQ